MNKDWQELTKITRGAPLLIERVKLKDEDLALEGSFELPSLAQLTMEDQVFVTAFIRSHGSIKDMQKLFGVSYPTVKKRLNRLSQQLECVEINPPASKSEIMHQLARGEITVEDAVEKLREGR